VKRWLIEKWNALRGYGFYFADGALQIKPGTCPYPLRNDWSVKACIKAGDCGCDERSHISGGRP